MSPAALAVGRSSRFDSSRPDPVHVAALAAALVVNLSALTAALRPLPPSNAVRPTAPPELTVRWIPPPARPAVAPPPPPMPALPQRRAAPTPAPVAAHLPTTPPAPVMVDAGTLAAPPANPPASPTVEATPGTSPAAPVELAYRTAPLNFPTQALRAHMHGTVVLLVRVDESGRPLEVTVERSSGYDVLDRSAKAQVLASWRFQPAASGGKPVQAWARVPVTFDLRGG